MVFFRHLKSFRIMCGVDFILSIYIINYLVKTLVLKTTSLYRFPTTDYDSFRHLFAVYSDGSFHFPKLVITINDCVEEN